MKPVTWIGIVIVIIIIGGVVWWMTTQPQNANTQGAGQNTATTGPSGDLTGTVSTTVGTGAPMQATVTYNGTSFSPSSVTIAKGGTVTFTSTAGNIWIASAPHPVHTAYDGTTASVHCAAGYTGPAPFDQCSAGPGFSFTFNKTGSFQYHDHLNTSAFGTVVVQ
ncbi:MAG: hypothetical protein KGI70_02460 [Patescibacteria group bacterium]|nr:hypothetical protein [Patescibacteria group bacterium]